MRNKIKNLFFSLFARHLSPQVKELYFSTLILNFAVAAVTIFEPIFLYLLFINKYGLNRALQLVLLFYLAVYVGYFFTLPLGAKFARRFGYEHSIALSTVFTALFYLSLFWASQYLWLLSFSVLFYVLSKLFYWPAYHADFARFASSGETGREISNLIVLISSVFILGPLIGGFILEIFSFNVLFVLVAILMLVSNIPMLITKEKFIPAPLSYFEPYQNLLARENRRRFFSYLGFGEELIVLVIWPIFMYLIIGDFFRLGALSAIAVLITTVIFLYIGRVADKKDKREGIRYGAVFYFFGWLVRFLSRGVLGVFLIDSYSRIFKQTIAIPMTAMIYEEAKDGSVMRTILFFEMSLVVGKILAILLSLLLLQFFTPGWNVMFLLAALFSLLYLFF